MEITETMIKAFWNAALAPSAIAEAYLDVRRGLAAVLSEIEKDYVSRKGLIKQYVPREALGMPDFMDGIKAGVTDQAKYMGASVPDIDAFQVIDPDPWSIRLTMDYVTLTWEIRRD